MSLTDSEFRGLMHRVRAGSDGAVMQLLELCGSSVYRAVRRKFHHKFRSRFDSEDFVQAVWASFFTKLPSVDKFTEFDRLVAFLVEVASNKVGQATYHHLKTQKRNMNREQSLGDVAGSSHPADRTPTPSQYAIADEQQQKFVRGQPSQYRKVLELRINGATCRAIADELEISERTVRRILDRMAKRIED